MPFVFENYLLDIERRELLRESEAVAVGPQVFDLLVYLIENRERVVSTENLLQAVWGQRIVSESTLASYISAARSAIDDNGREQRLIRTVARKGFRFIGQVKATSTLRDDSLSPSFTKTGRLSDNHDRARLSLPSKPSLAVLPFVNLSGDREQEYFADGVVEDITTALSRIRWLFVIARNSSFTYKGKVVDVKQIGRKLGVRYVLEGSVRRVSKRVRITGQLIDASTGVHLWANRFESTWAHLFEIQDEITESVVGALVPQLEQAEIERAKRKSTDSLDAYDYYLQGRASVNRGTKEDIDNGLPMFRKAIELDPEFASAYAMAAWCIVWRKINRWIVDRPREIAEGTYLTRKAIELGKNDAVALTRAGSALAHFEGDLDGSIALLDRALALDPNLAACWFLSGFLRVERGEPEEAIDYFQRAMRLSPLDPEMFRMQAGMALAHLFAKHFDTASVWAEKAYRDWPNFLLAIVIVAASHALAGHMAQARQALHHLRRLDPELCIASLEEWIPIRRSEDSDILAQGLRKAGLPERTPV
ncbi:winged helix-turn-helix domain-containing protein [Salinisphaera sp. SPP-AMP-43]|uniref:winged helix-turn-helix domain-containing tetratricopeptide repeat protein n=1 Tax=Salinisphaera sp. SPP-AMP-43 TaxID=3121288 RepID=UPI003C6DDB03